MLGVRGSGNLRSLPHDENRKANREQEYYLGKRRVEARVLTQSHDKAFCILDAIKAKDDVSFDIYLPYEATHRTKP